MPRSQALADKTSSADDSAPEESQKERVNRELREMLEETRVVLPGLELLFGFLLILPFNDRFASIDDVQRTVFIACLVVTGAATALLMGPSARHRLGFRTVDKERLLFIANRHLIVGLIFVAVSMALAIFLASSLVIGRTWASLLAGAFGLWFGLWWFVVPLVRKC